MSPNQNLVVSLPDNSKIAVHYIGDVIISASLTLKDVLYGPSFQGNILSSSTLLKDQNIHMVFTKSSCLIQDLHHVIGKGDVSHGLYLLKVPHIASASANANMSAPALWHSRLGHPSDVVLSLLKNSIPSIFVDDSCSICRLAKQIRLSFPKESITIVVKHLHLFTVIFGDLLKFQLSINNNIYLL